MPVTRTDRVFNRSKIAPITLALREFPYASQKSNLLRRQSEDGWDQPPTPSFWNVPPPSSDGDSDEAKKSSESDSEGEDHSDGEENPEQHNPFEPTTEPKKGKHMIDHSTTVEGNPYVSNPTVASGPAPTSSIITITVTQSSFNTQPTAGSNAAASTSSPDADITASSSPNHTAPIIIASVLVTVSVVVIGYMIFRYCTPLKARLVTYYRRKGERLPGEEDGSATRDRGPSMSQTNGPSPRTAEVLRYSTSLQPANVSTVGLYSTAQPPLVGYSVSPEKDPENPFSDQVPLSRSDSSSTIWSLGRQLASDGSNLDSRPPTYTTYLRNEPSNYASDFSLSKYRTSLTVLSGENSLSHLAGLANNSSTAVGSSVSLQDNTSRSPLARNPSFLNTTTASGALSRTPSLPGVGETARNEGTIPISLDEGFHEEHAMAPTIQTLAQFSSLSSPDSMLDPRRSQYEPRIRKSITPSESASNGPFSPPPFPPALPAMAAMIDSRWSKNSSSVSGRGDRSRGNIRGTINGYGTPVPPPLRLLVRRSASPGAESSVSRRGSMGRSGLI